VVAGTGDPGSDVDVREVASPSEVSVSRPDAEPPAPSTTFRPGATPITTFPPATDPALPPPAWEPLEIEVPVALARVGGELVAVTAEGVLVEIDLATGGAARLDLDERFDGFGLHVGSSASLLVPGYGRQAPILVPSGGVPLPFEQLSDDRDGNVSVTGIDRAGDRFFLALDGPPGRREVVVGADGSVRELAPFGYPYGRAVIVGGQTIVTDAGGVYRYDPTASLEDRSAERLSPGWISATGDGHLLVRECDEELRCRHAVIAVDGSSRRPALLPEPDAFVAIGTLSPDGTRLLEIPLPPDGSFPDGDPDERLVDLATGAVTAVDVIPPGRLPEEVVWSADGTALVAVASDGRLVVADAATGARSEVELDLGGADRIVDIGLRP
jgi:hypothetical protein